MMLQQASTCHKLCFMCLIIFNHEHRGSTNHFFLFILITIKAVDCMYIWYAPKLEKYVLHFLKADLDS